MVTTVLLGFYCNSLHSITDSQSKFSHTHTYIHECACVRAVICFKCALVCCWQIIVVASFYFSHFSCSRNWCRHRYCNLSAPRQHCQLLPRLVSHLWCLCTRISLLLLSPCVRHIFGIYFLSASCQ